VPRPVLVPVVPVPLVPVPEPLEPLVPLEPLEPLPLVPLVPPVVLVPPLVPLDPCEPLAPVPIAPVLPLEPVPVAPVWPLVEPALPPLVEPLPVPLIEPVPVLPLEPLEPLALEPLWAALLFLCFFFMWLALVLLLPELCPLACEPDCCEPDWSALLLDCALALKDRAMAVATEAPSIAFNNFCIFISISSIFAVGKNSAISMTCERFQCRRAISERARGSLPEITGASLRAGLSSTAGTDFGTVFMSRLHKVLQFLHKKARLLPSYNR
jgi:hypothetical protein